MITGTVIICGRDWPFLLHDNKWTLYLAEDYTVQFLNDKTVVARMSSAVERYLAINGMIEDRQAVLDRISDG